MNNINVIILGDFNLHVNDPNDDNAMNFVETTQALALEQCEIPYTYIWQHVRPSIH